VILVCDVGNTETTIGLFDGVELRAQWRIITGVERTADEFMLLLRALLDAEGVKEQQVRGSALGSVVPRVTGPLAGACRRCFGAEPVVVDARAGLRRPRHGDDLRLHHRRRRLSRRRHPARRAHLG
jgi:type III pantothenate kinase